MAKRRLRGKSAAQKAANKERLIADYIKFSLLMGAIFLVSLVANSYAQGTDLEGWMRVFLGLFILSFALYKIVNYEDWIEIFPSYDLVAGRAKIYGYIFPLIQLFVATLFLLNLFVEFRNVFSLIVAATALLGVLHAFVKKTHYDRSSVGTLLKLPLIYINTFEFSLVLILSIIMMSL